MRRRISPGEVTRTGGKPESEFSPAERLRSFSFAFRGIVELLRTQHNAWIHAAASVGVVGLAIGLKISALEWIALILAMGLVWAAEAANTAIEYLADEISTEQRTGLGRAKDLGAAAVFISALAAASVGLIVLGPPVVRFLWPVK